MLLYAITIFLSAFLLFQVQPIIAKMILPWFGGSSSVWATCMLFFQAALLLGYSYAHWVNEKLRPRKQLLLHTLLLALSLAALPILPGAAWKPTGHENPSLLILGLLAATIGLPYMLLSTTSPLLQAWYARTHKNAMPYRLFALSNFASMLALLTYPVLVEPNLSTRHQAQIWSAGYAAFALLCGVTALRAVRARRESEGALDPIEEVPPPSLGLRLLWLGLAACASALLLAVTNHITQDVAAMPFLWILPLALYLLSFILCFEARNLYWRPLFLPLFLIGVGYMGYGLWPYSDDWSVRINLLVYAGGLFACSMVCHGEVYRLRPHPRHLTVFYVMISLGGALGGLFVGLIAPNVFNAYYEFPILLVLAPMLVMTALWIQFRRWFSTLPGRLAAIAAFFLLGCAISGSWLLCKEMVEDYKLVVRNFYGQLRIYDDDSEQIPARKLYHGTINHGQQMLDGRYRRTPVTYYCPESGIGRVMAARAPGQPLRVGVLGLGCGTLAAFGRPGDSFRIYEINATVLDIANKWFTYLKVSPARIEYALGDGRLSLEREASQQFDVLVMDAFSGDSVPVHLITREAMGAYFRHLKPSGVLAVNISNRYLRLEPVMERAATYYGKVALDFSYAPDDEDQMCFSSTWVLIMDPATEASLAGKLGGSKRIPPQTSFRGWTDDYSNMFRVLKE